MPNLPNSTVRIFIFGAGLAEKCPTCQILRFAFFNLARGVFLGVCIETEYCYFCCSVARIRTSWKFISTGRARLESTFAVAVTSTEDIQQFTVSNACWEMPRYPNSTFRIFNFGAACAGKRPTSRIQHFVILYLAQTSNQSAQLIFSPKKNTIVAGRFSRLALVWAIVAGRVAV